MKFETRFFCVEKPDELELWMRSHTITCDFCGERLVLWPLSNNARHLLDVHEGMLTHAAKQIVVSVRDVLEQKDPQHWAEAAGGFVDRLLRDQLDYQRELLRAGIVTRRVQGLG